MASRLIAIVATLLLSRPWVGVEATRTCGAESASPTFEWSVSDFRFDGPDPARPSNSLATIGTYLIPTTRAYFTCIAEWPEAWGGFYENNLIWTRCQWTGPGANDDDTVSFAMDWKNKTVYMAHSYTCRDTARQGTTLVATASVTVNPACTTEPGSGARCFTEPTSYTVSTKQGAARLASSASCSDNSRRSQSWQVEKWRRQYDAPTDTTRVDKSLSFTLRSMANSDIFDCTSSAPAQGARKRQSGSVEGSCKSTAAAASNVTAAKFRFDPKTGMLTVTQSWTCDGATTTSFSAVGVAYVQDPCDRRSDSFDCVSETFWLGGKVA